MVMCLMVSLVAFANAFRAHFWYFQTKQRKLGCTIQEWLNAGVGG
jgi:intracellular multiplication protein IcmV